jgi:DNA polymerase elongation subunit (family B)
MTLKQPAKIGVTMEDPIGRITQGDTVIENGDEGEMINELNCLVAHANPDLIMTERGDSFELPYLHHRAALHDIDFQLEERRIYYLKAEENHISAMAEFSTNPGDTCSQGDCILTDQSFYSGKVDFLG